MVEEERVTFVIECDDCGKTIFDTIYKITDSIAPAEFGGDVKVKVKRICIHCVKAQYPEIADKAIDQFGIFDE